MNTDLCIVLPCKETWSGETGYLACMGNVSAPPLSHKSMDMNLVLLWLYNLLAHTIQIGRNGKIWSRHCLPKKRTTKKKQVYSVKDLNLCGSATKQIWTQGLHYLVCQSNHSANRDSQKHQWERGTLRKGKSWRIQVGMGSVEGGFSRGAEAAVGCHCSEISWWIWGWLGRGPLKVTNITEKIYYKCR